MIRQKRLQDLFLKAVFKYAVAIIIQNRDDVATKEERDITAHRAVIHAIGTITDHESAALRSTTEPLLSQDTAIHSINLEAQTDKTRQKAIQKVSAGLCEILFRSTIHLVLHHEELDAERVMTSQLKTSSKNQERRKQTRTSKR